MTIDPAYKIPRAYNWNVSYEREIGFETKLEIGYVGTTSNYLSRERDLNQLPFGTTFKTENAGANVNYLRPFKGYANIPMLEHSGRSEYNGFQIEATRRFKSGLAYGFAYTYSKTMDNNSGPPQVNKWLITIAVMAGTFMEIIDITVVNVALPQMAGSLAAGVDEVSIFLCRQPDQRRGRP